jgi:hypothetical protein|nr:hypothetical protein [Kofleriaceae bacterium]
MTYLRVCAALALAVVATVSTGCGLISSDVTDFDLTLPPKTFTIDAASWQVDGSAAQAVLSQSCAQQPTACEQAAEAACKTGCSGTCDGGTQTCDMAFAVSLYQNVNLVMEKPELQTINSEPVIKVTIDSVDYDVDMNTLNVDTPPMTIFVAPATVMDPTDPSAVAIGTLAAQPAGQTSASQSLMFTDTGKQKLIDTMSNFKTPFNIIVGTTLNVMMGDPVPMGALEAVVHITAHASL